MRNAIIVMLNIVFLQGLFSQDSTKIMDMELSPKGDIELQYVDSDSCLCMDVWLISQEDSTQKFILDSATTLGTKYFFSPDENWIAANFEYVSNYRTVILFKRVEGIRYKKVENAQIYEKGVEFMAKIRHLRNVPEFGHSIAEILKWSPDSKSFLFKIRAWDNNQGFTIRDWTSIFNVELLSVSGDKRNNGWLIHERK